MEDILSTYCVDNNQGAPGEDGVQGEPPEPEDAEKSRAYVARNGEPEPGTPVVNGEKETSKAEPGTEEIRTSDEVGDRDHRRPQEKKKAKGLGEQRAAAGGLSGGGLHLTLLGCAAGSLPGLFKAQGIPATARSCSGWEQVKWSLTPHQQSGEVWVGSLPAHTASSLLCDLGHVLSPPRAIVSSSLQGEDWARPKLQTQTSV